MSTAMWRDWRFHVEFGEELTEGDTQSAAQLIGGNYGYGLLATLNGPDVGPVKAAPAGEFLLGDSGRGPQPTNEGTYPSGERGVFHASTIGRCTL